MKEADSLERESLDAVLAGMGGAQPASGMEARVLARLALERAPERAAGAWWAPLWWVGAVTVLACIAGAGLLVRRGPQPVQVAGPAAGARQSVPSAHPVAGVALLQAPLHRAARVAGSRAAQRGGTTRDARVAALEPVSFPAPPMPLTRQERLLLRMLNGGQTAELVATLNPGAETAVRRVENAEFSRFFRAPLADGTTTPLRDTGLDVGMSTGAGSAVPSPAKSTESESQGEKQ